MQIFVEIIMYYLWYKKDVKDMSKNYPLNYDLTKSFISISESFSKLNFDTKSFMGIKDSLTKSIISMSESFSKLN